MITFWIDRVNEQRVSRGLAAMFNPLPPHPTLLVVIPLCLYTALRHSYYQSRKVMTIVKAR